MTPLVNTYKNKKKKIKLFKRTSTWSNVCITLSRGNRSRFPPECITLKKLYNSKFTFLLSFFLSKTEIFFPFHNIFSATKQSITRMKSRRTAHVMRYLERNAGTFPPKEIPSISTDTESLESPISLSPSL